MDKDIIITKHVHKVYLEELQAIAVAKVIQYFDKSGELSAKIAKDIDRLAMQVFGDMLRDYRVMDRAETYAKIKYVIYKLVESHADTITEQVFNIEKQGS